MIKVICFTFVLISFNAFSLDLSSESEFRLQPRESVHADQIEFDEEKVEKDSFAEKESQNNKNEGDRSPSSFEKKRQEAVHWKIQQIIERRDRF